MGKMIPAKEANAMDGHRAERGRESEIHEEVRAPMIVRMLI
jgi:hypothetical protein